VIGERLRRWSTAGPCELAFVVRAPSADERFFVLLDRSGVVLGRTRELDQCLAILARHLGVFLPRPMSTTRFRARALRYADDTATVALSPLCLVPPPVERRLEASGCRLIDRIAVDLDASCGIRTTDEPWSTEPSDVPGHVGSAAGVTVTSLIVPGTDAAPPTDGGVAAMLASPIVAGDDRHAALAAVTELVDLDVAVVAIDDQAELYRVLRRG
jgi:hypothetical protein